METKFIKGFFSESALKPFEKIDTDLFVDSPILRFDGNKLVRSVDKSMKIAKKIKLDGEVIKPLIDYIRETLDKPIYTICNSYYGELVRYDPGDFTTWHYDYNSYFISNCIACTGMIYLHQADEGGETEIEDVTVNGGYGDFLLFDKSRFHRGKEVLKGYKLVIIVDILIDILMPRDKIYKLNCLDGHVFLDEKNLDKKIKRKYCKKSSTNEINIPLNKSEVLCQTKLENDYINPKSDKYQVILHNFINSNELFKVCSPKEYDGMVDIIQECFPKLICITASIINIKHSYSPEDSSICDEDIRLIPWIAANHSLLLRMYGMTYEIDGDDDDDDNDNDDDEDDVCRKFDDDDNHSKSKKSEYFQPGKKEDYLLKEMVCCLNSSNLSSEIKGEGDARSTSIYGPRKCTFYNKKEEIKNPTILISNQYAGESTYQKCAKNKHIDSYVIHKDKDQSIKITQQEIDSLIKNLISDEFLTEIKLGNIKSIAKVRDWGRDSILVDFVDYFSIFLVIKREYLSK